MKKFSQPWLRFMEGPGGNNGGGQGGTGDNGGGTGAAGNAGDAGKDTGGDQGSGDRGSGESKGGGDGGSKNDADFIDKYKQATGDKKTSEPAPKQGEKADAGDSDEVAALKAEMAAMRESIGTLTKDQEDRAEKERAALTSGVAKAAGLPDSMAGRLQGDTQEQLEEDAKKLAQDLGFRVVDPTQGQGKGGSRPAISMDEAIKAKIAAAGLK